MVDACRCISWLSRDRLETPPRPHAAVPHAAAALSCRCGRWYSFAGRCNARGIHLICCSCSAQAARPVALCRRGSWPCGGPTSSISSESQPERLPGIRAERSSVGQGIGRRPLQSYRAATPEGRCRYGRRRPGVHQAARLKRLEIGTMPVILPDRPRVALRRDTGFRQKGSNGFKLDSVSTAESTTLAAPSPTITGRVAFLLDSDFRGGFP